MVITEVMFNPTHGLDTSHEWIETRNDAGDAVEPDGLTLADESGSKKLSGSLVVENGAYVVLGVGSGASWTYPFTPDAFYGSIAFNNAPPVT